MCVRAPERSANFPERILYSFSDESEKSQPASHQMSRQHMSLHAERRIKTKEGGRMLCGNESAACDVRTAARPSLTLSSPAIIFKCHTDDDDSQRGEMLLGCGFYAL